MLKLTESSRPSSSSAVPITARSNPHSNFSSHFSPYEILDLDDVAKPDEIKKKYRQVSLFIHPDKCPHPRAPDAFDLAKKAEQELSDENKREELDSLINRARSDLLKSHGIPSNAAKDDLRVLSLFPPFKLQLRGRVKDMLIEEELRRRK